MSLPAAKDFRSLMDSWDPKVPLDGPELKTWIDLYRTREFSQLHDFERHGHVRVPMDGNPLSSNLGPAIQAKGYKRYIADWESLPTDQAGRRVLSTEVSARSGVAWMTYRKDRPVRDEGDMTGLMYVLHPERNFDPTADHPTGWRSLPVAEMLRRPNVLFHEGRVWLDNLEAENAMIVEVSGLSVHPDAPHKGWAFHEIMRRIVHDGVAQYLKTGRETVLLFAIVLETRNNVRKRLGKYNFIDIGRPVHPGGDNVEGTTRLMPSILLISNFFSRMVSSYRERVAHGQPALTLEEGIKFYTKGLDPVHLAHYPEMVKLLDEIG